MGLVVPILVHPLLGLLLLLVYLMMPSAEGIALTFAGIILVAAIFLGYIFLVLRPKCFSKFYEYFASWRKKRENTQALQNKGDVTKSTSLPQKRKAQVPKEPWSISGVGSSSSSTRKSKLPQTSKSTSVKNKIAAAKPSAEKQSKQTFSGASTSKREKKITREKPLANLPKQNNTLKANETTKSASEAKVVTSKNRSTKDEETAEKNEIPRKPTEQKEGPPSVSQNLKLKPRINSALPKNQSTKEKEKTGKNGISRMQTEQKAGPSSGTQPKPFTEKKISVTKKRDIQKIEVDKETKTTGDSVKRNVHVPECKRPATNAKNRSTKDKETAEKNEIPRKPTEQKEGPPSVSQNLKLKLRINSALPKNQSTKEKEKTGKNEIPRKKTEQKAGPSSGTQLKPFTKKKIPATKMDSTTAKPTQRSSGRNNIRKIPCNFAKGFYNFTLSKDGGFLKLLFLHVIFPPNCVKKEKKLRIKKVLPKDTKRKRGIKFITPTVHLLEQGKSSAVKFECPIELYIRLLYYPADRVTKVQLEITEDLTDLNWTEAEKLNFTKKQEVILLKLQKFAGFRVVCKNSTRLIPTCDLFHALFVKRPTGISDPVQHNFCVLIHSSDEKMCNEADKILDSASTDVVFYKQCLPIRPPCTFTASLNCEAMTSAPKQIDFDIDTLHDRVLTTLPISVKKENEDLTIHPLQHVPLVYRAWSTDQGRPREMQFRWSMPTEQSCPSCSASSVGSCSVINASSGGIGQQNNYNYCTINTPTPSEGTLHLRHNISEPILGEHPHGVAREQSLPANYGSTQLSNQVNPWFPPSKPNQLPESREPTRVDNLDVSTQNDAVPKHISLRHRSSEPLLRNSTVPHEASNSCDETVCKEVVTGSFHGAKQFFNEETMPKSIAYTVQEVKSKGVASSNAEPAHTDQNFGGETSPKSFYIGGDSDLQYANSGVTPKMVIRASTDDLVSDRQNFDSNTVPKTVNMGNSYNQNEVVGADSVLSGNVFTEDKAPISVNQTSLTKSTFSGAQSESHTTFTPATSDILECSSEKAYDPNILQETSPKEIANESSFEHSSPNLHSTPTRPSTISELPTSPVGDGLNTSAKAHEVTSDSAIEFGETPEGDEPSLSKI